MADEPELPTSLPDNPVPPKIELPFQPKVDLSASASSGGVTPISPLTAGAPVRSGPPRRPGAVTGRQGGPTAAKAANPAPEPFEFQGLADAGSILNILYYGPGGSGKTTALAHMAKLGKVLFINAEGGIKAKPLARLGVPLDNIKVFPNPKLDERIDYPSLERIFWQLKGDLQADSDTWVGVVWDSLTEIHKKVLELVQTDAYARDLRKGNPKDRQPFDVQLQDYGTMTEMLRLLIRRYRDLPCHFGISALERREQDDDSRVTYNPAVTPALQADVFGYMDVVIHTSMVEVGDEEEYRGLSRPSGKFRGKDRLGMLPKRMPNPTFDRVLGYIDEDITWDTDPEVELSRQRQPEAPPTPA